MFILLRFRSDGLFGRRPRGKKVFGKVHVFLHRSCCFQSFLVGILCSESDLQGFRVYFFVAFSIRWFVW